jgi:two-component sensor histidine kinase
LGLSADTARHLALVFHELVTNAAKHGALSTHGGRVLISWKHVGGVVRLEWTEQGGPVVRPAEKHGFGTGIVTQSLKALGGSIAPTFTRGAALLDHLSSVGGCTGRAPL